MITYHTYVQDIWDQMIDLFYKNMLFIMSTEVVLPMINSRYISHNDFMVDIIKIIFKLIKILKSYHKETSQFRVPPRDETEYVHAVCHSNT